MTANAQQPPIGATPGATLERTRDTLEERERRERARKRQEKTESAIIDELNRQQIVPPHMRHIAVEVRRIEISDSSILSASDLRALAAEYEGRTLTVADLHELVSRINQLYIDRHQITSRAILPP
ncbi:MAG: hypothetical protein IIB38_13845, partial [Candidatus Hydrogenedentes bacterium]|nr:hypothetical protein [Candidatus Hydrogenedentota bacterium]